MSVQNTTEELQELLRKLYNCLPRPLYWTNEKMEVVKEVEQALRKASVTQTVINEIYRFQKETGEQPSMLFVSDNIVNKLRLEWSPFMVPADIKGPTRFQDIPVFRVIEPDIIKAL